MLWRLAKVHWRENEQLVISKPVAPTLTNAISAQIKVRR
jgi:hypothetical protein